MNHPSWGKGSILPHAILNKSSSLLGFQIVVTMICGAYTN